MTALTLTFCASAQVAAAASADAIRIEWMVRMDQFSSGTMPPLASHDTLRRLNGF
jgi:hypothetical protein